MTKVPLEAKTEPLLIPRNTLIVVSTWLAVNRDVQNRWGPARAHPLKRLEINYHMDQ